MFFLSQKIYTFKRESFPLKENMKSNKVAGKSFALTGTFSHPRDEMISLIDKNDGIFHGNLKKSTDFLVAGASIGFKVTARAEALGVKIIHEKEFLKMLNGGREIKGDLHPHRGKKDYGQFRGKYRFSEQVSDIKSVTSELLSAAQKIRDLPRGFGGFGASYEPEWKTINLTLDTPREMRHPEENERMFDNPKWKKTIEKWEELEGKIFDLLDEFKNKYPNFIFESCGEVSGGGVMVIKKHSWSNFLSEARWHSKWSPEIGRVMRGIPEPGPHPGQLDPKCPAVEAWYEATDDMPEDIQEEEYRDFYEKHIKKCELCRRNASLREGRKRMIKLSELKRIIREEVSSQDLEEASGNTSYLPPTEGSFKVWLKGLPEFNTLKKQYFRGRPIARHLKVKYRHLLTYWPIDDIERTLEEIFEA